ncbi:hypothetical protein D3C72_2400400 [compost metagenome]
MGNVSRAAYIISPLHGILKLARISRPLIALQGLQKGGAETFGRTGMITVALQQEQSRQRGDILPAFP